MSEHSLHPYLLSGFLETLDLWTGLPGKIEGFIIV